jgi:myo-inositol 2-dehydrogenase / D-chiro-inositol 1-dehydrogenase
MLRVVVVGAGNHSEVNHGPSLRDVAARHPGEVELAAVCDLAREKAEAYASQFGFARKYTDVHEMVKREAPDAIVAVTPVAVTRPLVGELLRYRIPLLIEKPPGTTPAEARELLEIATRHGTPHMVSFNRRFVPAVVRARAWLAARGPGERPRLLVARMLRSKRREAEFVTGTGIHLIDAVLSFMGTPAAIAHHRSTTPAGGQCCDARLEFAGGSAAIVVIAPDAGCDEETYEIIGPDYAIAIESLASRLSIRRGGAEEASWSPEPAAPTYIVHGCLEETEAFVAAVAGRRPYAPTLAEGVLSVETAHALDWRPSP